jgi:hypothetical protein
MITYNEYPLHKYEDMDLEHLLRLLLCIMATDLVHHLQHRQFTMDMDLEPLLLHHLCIMAMDLVHHLPTLSNIDLTPTHRLQTHSLILVRLLHQLLHRTEVSMPLKIMDIIPLAQSLHVLPHLELLD